MKNGIWHLLVGILASSMLTGAGAWLAFGMDTITRSEMTEYVQNQTPWVRDKGVIISGVNNNKEEITRLKELVEKSTASQQQLVIEQRVLVSRVDDLREKIDRLIRTIEKNG